MTTSIDPSRIFTRKQVDDLLSSAIGKTLLQADTTGLFEHHEGCEKMKGIAGDIIEGSVLGCKKDSKQEPDILVDGVLTEIKTTGMIKPKKDTSPYVFECKEPVSVTAVSIPVIVTEEFETSNFWYKSQFTVKLDDYNISPILGYPLYEFGKEDKLLHDEKMPQFVFIVFSEIFHRVPVIENVICDSHPTMPFVIFNPTCKAA